MRPKNWFAIFLFFRESGITMIPIIETIKDCSI